MKRLCFILIALWAVTTVYAGARSSADALRIAGEFVSNSVAVQQPQRSGSPKDSLTAQRSYIADSSAVCFAVNTEKGFVLVGADDRLPEVLGYSDSRSFDPSDMPPALRFWMQCYEEELSNSQLSTLHTASADRSRPCRDKNYQLSTINYQLSISPLLSSQWNQSAPYNNLAPAYNSSGAKSAAGCVATAMAQVMNYYRYPAYGTGSHSYLWVCTATPELSTTLSADFGQTAYDWANMLDSYKSGYTSAQATAVATLMYHCGVAVEMGYGASSGAYTERVPAALKTWFGYDPNYQRIRKSMYPADSLNAIIYSELAAKRPVLVSGFNDEGGHAFVCDGADSRGYFHINWGWGGSNDGYYLLSALNPGKAQGIGGTTKGYNQSTAFYIGVQPAGKQTPPAVPQMADSLFTISATSFSRSENFTVSVYKMQNFGLTDFSGSYGVALYDEDEKELVSVLKQQDNYSLSAGYYRTTVAALSRLSIPSSVPDGNYHLCVVYRNADYGWMRMMSTADDYYLSLSIADGKVSIYPNNAEPELTLTDAISFGQDVNTDSIPMTGKPLSFAIRNTGGTFRGEISARIYKGAFSKGQYEIVSGVVIRRNETFSSALQQTFDENLLTDTQYKMRLCWRKDADDSWHNFTPSEYGELPFKLCIPQDKPDDPEVTTALERHAADQDTDGKYMRDGRLFIRRDGKTYNAQGMLMK